MPLFTRPEVGKTVTVVTDWSDHYAVYCDYVSITRNKKTKTGTVVESTHFDDPASFRLTTDIPHFPVCVIPLARVVELEFSDGTEAQNVESDAPENEEWAVAGSNGTTYAVTLRGSLWHCECKGWMFRSQCKHVNEKKEEILNRS